MAMLSAIAQMLKRSWGATAIPDFGNAIATKKIAAKATAAHPNQRLNARKDRIDAAAAARKTPMTPLLIVCTRASDVCQGSRYLQVDPVSGSVVSRARCRERNHRARCEDKRGAQGGG
jgi:hypothetical protein